MGDESEGDDEEESEEESEEEVVIEEEEVSESASEEDEEETEEEKDEDEGDVDEDEENDDGKEDNKVDEEEGKYDKEEENSDDGDRLVSVKGAGNESSGNDTWVKKPQKDLLSEGERISMKPLTGNKKGVQFRYCFKNPEECNEDYALERCAQINLDYECSEKKTSCMFKHFKKDSKCCLRYECLGIDLPQEGEDYEEESVKREEENISQDSEKSKASQDEAGLANLESPQGKISQTCIGDIKDKKDCSKWAVKMCKGFDADSPGMCSGKCQFRLRHSECCVRHNATCEGQDYNLNDNVENEEQNKEKYEKGTGENDEENKAEKHGERDEMKKKK